MVVRDGEPPKGRTGRDYGVQWTLFRTALAPGTGEGWESPQLWMGHMGVTTPEAHYVAERMARGGIGQAGVEAEPFRAWIDDWSFAGPSPAEAVLTASGGGVGYELTLDAQGPFVAQGRGGYSVKSAGGQASYYYSQPFYEVAGTLTLPEGEVAVTGTAWMDREWSSQPLSEGQTGWDWFSLVFDERGADDGVPPARRRGGGLHLGDLDRAGRHADAVRGRGAGGGAAGGRRRSPGARCRCAGA